MISAAKQVLGQTSQETMPQSTKQPLTFSPASVAPPKPTYSQVSTYNIAGPCKFIAVAGQVGRDPITHEAPPDFAEQVVNALANMQQCLAAAGATTRDIIKVTQYIVNYDPKETQRAKIYLEHMDGHIPPSTLVPVPALAEPDLLYEIEALAIVATEA